MPAAQFARRRLAHDVTPVRGHPTGSASATAARGFSLTAAAVEGGRNGQFFFGANGRQANAWGNGTSSQCVQPPVARGQPARQRHDGCDGAYVQDQSALWTAKPPRNPGAGLGDRLPG